ncbi:MAG: nuclear transport factor 2 family protein, partial [Pseudomonadota bacterium]
MTDTALSETDANAIKQMMEEWTTALTEKDWDKWQGYWAEDGVLMPPDHERIVGRSDLVAFASGNFGPVKSFAFADWTFDGLGDLAVVTNTISIEFDGDDAAEIAACNDQMLFLRRYAD